MSTADVLPCLIVALLASLLTFVATLRAPHIERDLVRGSLLLHFVSSFAMLWLMDQVFQGASDSNVYLEQAQPLVALLDQRFADTFVEILRLIVNLPCQLPGFEEGGGPTASMVGMTALGVFFASGSVWAIFLAYGIFGFLGQWAIYAALRDELPAVPKQHLGVAVLLLPSAIFWTSGLVKETFALAGLGLLFRGTQLLRRRLDITAVAVGLLGLALVASFKPYLLFPYALGVRSWLLGVPNTRYPLLRPLVAVTGIVFAVAAIAALGRAFPEFAADKVVESAASLQARGAEAGGGSYYGLGSVENKSTAGRLVLAPIALLTTLTRPFFFEAHNVSSGITALETLIITVLGVQAVRRTGIARMRELMEKLPVLAFCAVFVVVAATAVGMATSNFGTLARYRVPLLPFYTAFIVAMRALGRTADVEEDAPDEPAVSGRGVLAHPRGRRKLRGLGWLR